MSVQPPNSGHRKDATARRKSATKRHRDEAGAHLTMEASALAK